MAQVLLSNGGKESDSKSPGDALIRAADRAHRARQLAEERLEPGDALRVYVEQIEVVTRRHRRA